MNKEKIREYYKNIRRNIVDREKKNQEICKKLLVDENVKKSALILIYVSTDSEVNTINIIEELLKTKIVAVPKVEEEGIKFYLINNLGDLKVGNFNILEPTTNLQVTDFNNSVCVVPGICFDKENNRLGYGGGYYDKFLSNYPEFTIGLCYEECIVASLEVEPHDIKLQKIICK